MVAPRLDGVDTSHYQGLADPTLIPELTFAMHKASEGASYQDPTLQAFTVGYRAAHKAGRVGHVGFYHFLRTAVVDGQLKHPIAVQVRNFVDAINDQGGLQPSEFWVVDWERGADGKCATLAELIEFFTLTAKALGKNRGLVYSAPWVPGFKEWRTANPGVGLILANYRTSPLLPFNGWAESKRWNATAWQWTSAGLLPGVTGRLDLNHVWDPTWFAKLNPPKPVPVTVPKPTLKFFARNNPTEVTKLKAQLRFWGWHKGRVDNVFDIPTHRAVKAMQTALKIKATGAYDLPTANALRGFLEGMQSYAAATGTK